MAAQSPPPSGSLRADAAPGPRGKIAGMIQVTVNGAPHRFERPVSIGSLLEELKMAGRKIAVERNGEIVPRGLHGNTLVENGDRLEIVVAVGGG